MFRVMRFAITSFSNEKVKYVSGLKEKKNRDKNKHFFLEGFRELKKGFESKKFTFHSLFVSQECFLGINEDNLIDEIEKSGTPIFELPRNPTASLPLEIFLTLVFQEQKKFREIFLQL